MIKNLSKNTILYKSFEAKTGFSRIKGLIGEDMKKAIVFKTRFGLHTFFMKFPIDIVVLDKNNSVAFLKRNVKPNKFIFWNLRFNIVIELPNGEISKSKTEIGDKIKFIL